MTRIKTTRGVCRAAALGAVTLGGLAATVTAIAADAENAGAASQRGAIASIGHYVAHNSYAKFGPFRARYFGDSNNLQVDGALAQSLAGGSSVPGSGTSISNETSIGLALGLFIPKTDHHVSLEFALAPPLEYDLQVKGAGQTIGSMGAAAAVLGGPIGEDIGDSKTLAPNFTLVFRPFTDTVLQPYIGAGAMYLHTYHDRVNNPRFKRAAEALNATPAGITLSDEWACVGQLGLDIQVPDEPLFFSIGARYVGCATVDETLQLGTIKSGPLAGTELGTIETENDYKALLYQASFGIKF